MRLDSIKLRISERESYKFPILSYENEISFTCNLNTFSYEWLYPRPRFEKEAQDNSQMGYSLYETRPRGIMLVVFITKISTDISDCDSP